LLRLHCVNFIVVVSIINWWRSRHYLTNRIILILLFYFLSRPRCCCCCWLLYICLLHQWTLYCNYIFVLQFGRHQTDTAKRRRGAVIIFTNYNFARIMFSRWFHYSTLETLSILTQPDLSYDNPIFLMISCRYGRTNRLLLTRGFRWLTMNWHIWIITLSWRFIWMYVFFLGYLTCHHVFFRSSIISHTFILLIFSNVSIIILSVELLVSSYRAHLLLRLHLVLLEEATLIIQLLEHVVGIHNFILHGSEWHTCLAIKLPILIWIRATDLWALIDLSILSGSPSLSPL
jgi:hypothetical protein